jgi:FG-GAP repeat
MRRIAVLLVLGLAVGAWPAASAVAHGTTVAQAAPVRSLQADFDGDGADDLAIGAPLESVGSILAAGAVNVLYGSATGLSGTGSQLFTQDTPGVGSSAEEGDAFGWTLATGNFNGDTFADLAIGAPFENAGSIADAGAVSVLPGSAAGLTTTGAQLFTQDTPGVGSSAEEVDLFGFGLATGDPGPATTSASPSGPSSGARRTSSAR